LTKVTNFGYILLGIQKGSGPGASINALSTASAFLRVDGNHPGPGIFLDCLHWANRKAGGRGAMAAYGQPKKPFVLLIFFHPDQGLIIVKRLLLL
jgi:hypothetical protein